MGTLMKCGHTTHAVNVKTLEPVCVICVGINPDARTPATEEEATEATTGRMMRCSYRHGQNGKVCDARANPRPSNASAAFFSSKQDQEFDEFYCGCWGWD